MPDSGDDESNIPLTGYQYWEDHPRYESSDWRREVADENTRAGYWAWVKNQLAEEKTTEEAGEYE